MLIPYMGKNLYFYLCQGPTFSKQSKDNLYQNAMAEG